jgi:putative spermidine/putrescine transport system substrate-binding protein
MDGMWANYLQPWQGVAYNTTVMKTPPASWAEADDPKYKGRIIIPSLQNTEGLPNLFMAAHLATGKPMAEATEGHESPASRSCISLKPNLLTSTTRCRRPSACWSRARRT